MTLPLRLFPFSQTNDNKTNLVGGRSKADPALGTGLTQTSKAWNVSASNWNCLCWTEKAPICPNLDKSDWFKALAMLRENTSIKMPKEGLNRCNLCNGNFCATEVVFWGHGKTDKKFIRCSQKDRFENLYHTTTQGIHCVLKYTFSNFMTLPKWRSWTSIDRVFPRCPIRGSVLLLHFFFGSSSKTPTHQPWQFFF